MSTTPHWKKILVPTDFSEDSLTAVREARRFQQLTQAEVVQVTDIDAITLSTSRLVSTAHLDTRTAWRMILLGGMASVVFKMGLVAVLGARAFIKPALFGLGTAWTGGAAILVI